MLLPCSPEGLPFADHHRLTVNFSSSERGTHTWNIHITVWECGTWTIEGDREMRKVLTHDEYSGWLCEFWVTIAGELYRDAYPEQFPWARPASGVICAPVTAVAGLPSVLAISSSLRARTVIFHLSSR